MRSVFKPVVVLTMICIVVAGLLAYVNSVTKPVINAAADREAAAARKDVLPTATSFKELDMDDKPEGVVAVFRGSGDSGYVFMVSHKGYGGDVNLICGIDLNGRLVSVRTLSHSETNGIGSMVVDNSSDYRLKFTGLTSEELDSVDTVTGATISSTAYKKAVASAFEAYSALKEAEK